MDDPDGRPVTRAQTHEDDAEPRTPVYWVDEKGHLHPKPHKVKGRWQETARDLVLFPLLKLAALILALIILGGIASGSGSYGGGEELSETSIVSVIVAGMR